MFGIEINIVALLLLLVSLWYSFKIKQLMGTGRDAGPINLLLIVMGVIIVMTVSLLYTLVSAFWFDYVQYAWTMNLTLLVAGIVLSIMTYRTHLEYKQLLRKHEPNR